MKHNKTRKNYFGLTFISTSDDTNGQYFFSETTIPAGDPGPPLHFHSKENESFYLKKGKLLFNVNGKEFELTEGENLIVEKGEKHTWKNLSATDAELIIIFTPPGIENMFIELEEDFGHIKEIGLKYGTEFLI